MLTKDDFITKTLEQIRWKKAHDSVRKELSDHIEDQKNAFLDMNMDENEAEEMAVQEMGDPVEVGALLDNSYRPRTDKGLIFGGVMLTLVGILISCILDFGAFAQPTYLIGFAIALPIAFIIPFFLDVSTIYKNIWWAVGIYIIFLLWAAVFAYNTRVLIRLVTYSAFMMPPLYTALMFRMRTKGYLGFVISFVLLGVMTALQFSMSGGIAFTLTSYGICVIMSVYAVMKGWFGGKIRPLGMMAICGVLMGWYVLTTPMNYYILSRLKRMFVPSSDPLGYGWQTLQARDFLSRSVFLGRGAGESAINGIPGYHTDYALTSLIHRFGYIAAILLGVVMMIFIVKLCLKTRKQTSQLARSTSYAVILIYAVNTLIFFLVNLGIIGSISTCPAFIFGGKAAMVVSAFLLGIIVSTNRNGSIISDNTAVKSLFKVEKFENKLVITIGEDE